MPRTEQSRTLAVPPQAGDLSPAAEPPPESLEKVRDILFGSQMRAVESRIQNLEERLLREQELMRADLQTSIREADAHARKELQALGERLTTERESRIEELKSLGNELREAVRALERRHVRLEEASNAADAELRDGLLEHSRAVSAEIERLSQRVASDLNREVQGLRHDKLDIAAMAGVLSDMATRLGNDSHAPAKNAVRS